MTIHTHHMINGERVEITPEEIAQFEAQAAEKEALKDAKQAKSVRILRNAKLAECDWTQLDDFAGGGKLAWATYRQALRDVPTQAGFPWTVTWPDAP